MPNGSAFWPAFHVGAPVLGRVSRAGVVTFGLFCLHLFFLLQNLGFMRAECML